MRGDEGVSFAVTQLLSENGSPGSFLPFGEFPDILGNRFPGLGLFI